MIGICAIRLTPPPYVCQIENALSQSGPAMAFTLAQQAHEAGDSAGTSLLVETRPYPQLLCIARVSAIQRTQLTRNRYAPPFPGP